MAEPYVCDITGIMRARLACGIYNHRSVPPRWRPLARAYCVALPVVISYFFFSYTHTDWSFTYSLYVIPTLFEYYLSILVSLWTGDEYIYKFFRQNNFTDVTLDSRKIFSLLQKQLKQVMVIWFLFYIFGLSLICSVGFNFLLIFIDKVVLLSCSRNLLIMALFDARLLVLKRRLQRYGFRTIGQAQPQPYCQVYDEILRGLDETDQPLKLLLLFDIICTCCKLISVTMYYIVDVTWENFNYFELSGKVLLFLLTLLEQLIFSLGFVGYLDSGAAHCDDMALFTVTQLIKTPTADERRRMRDFVGALEHRGARYCVLRALPLDKRFVLRVLAFCTAQIFVIATSMLNKNK